MSKNEWYIKQQQYMKEWAESRGVTESDRSVCARKLLGKRCLSYYGHLDSPEYHDPTILGKTGCPGCDRIQGSCGIWDHPTIWRKNGKPEIIVVHPYFLSPKDEEVLKVWCEQMGLTYKIYPKSESWYNRDGTFMIEIRADKMPNGILRTPKIIAKYVTQNNSNRAHIIRYSEHNYGEKTYHALCGKYLWQPDVTVYDEKPDCLLVCIKCLDVARKHGYIIKREADEQNV